MRKEIKKFKHIKVQDAIKHPNWKMGKKISIDSATMMNKVLEVIEAFKLFPFNKNKYEIVIHPQSLVHAIVLFKNGQTKFLYHETDMRIPIANAIYENIIDIKNLGIKNKNILKNLDLLTFETVDKKNFQLLLYCPIISIMSLELLF